MNSPRFLRSLTLLLIAFMLLAAGSAPAQQRPTFEASVEQVRVDVIVTDGDGQFVDDLGFEDFLVFEDGAPQQVLNVQLVDLGVGTVADIQPLPAEGVSLPLPSEGVPPVVTGDREAPSPPTRPVGDTYGAMIYLIDGSSLDPGARIRFARQWGEMQNSVRSAVGRNARRDREIQRAACRLYIR